MLNWDSIELFFSDLMHETKERRLNKDVIGLVGASWKRGDKFHNGELPDEKNSHRAEDISKVQLIAKKYLAVHYPRLKTIKGYIAVGVIADRLELVEGHDLPSVLNLKDSIPRNSCGIEPSSIFASMDMFDDCRMISIDAAEVTIQVLRWRVQSFKPGIYRRSNRKGRQLGLHETRDAKDGQIPEPALQIRVSFFGKKPW